MQAVNVALLVGAWLVTVLITKRALREAGEQRSRAEEMQARLSAANADLSALAGGKGQDDDELTEREQLLVRAAESLEVLQRELATEKRKSKELFDVVETVLRERDQWKDMWFTHGREHLQAQHLLEQSIEQLRTWLRSSLIAVNKYRSAAGEAPLPFGADPKDPPVGTAQKFKDMLEQAQADAPSSVDGLALREAIVATESR
jgi:hypothetical protein